MMTPAQRWGIRLTEPKNEMATSYLSHNHISTLNMGLLNYIHGADTLHPLDTCGRGPCRVKLQVQFYTTIYFFYVVFRELFRDQWVSRGFSRGPEATHFPMGDP